MNPETYQALLDTSKSPIVFVDNDHVIRYLNQAAKIRYLKNRGYPELVGKSLFDCHNEQSEKQTREIHRRLLAGEDEIFLKVTRDNEKITVVAVRDTAGQLLGYYERFEAMSGTVPLQG